MHKGTIDLRFKPRDKLRYCYLILDMVDLRIYERCTGADKVVASQYGGSALRTSTSTCGQSRSLPRDKLHSTAGLSVHEKTE